MVKARVKSKITHELAMRPATIHSICASQKNSIITKVHSEYSPYFHTMMVYFASSSSPAEFLFFYSLRRQYLPLTMKEIQLLIDTNRLDASKPIDLTSICNTGLYRLDPSTFQFGFQLKDHNLEFFKAKINIEVQHATELVIATIEKNGGVIRTAYYDQHSLFAMRDPQKWLRRGAPIPRRALPPQDAVEYYTNPKNRGYLADPEEISKERLVRFYTFSAYDTRSLVEFLMACPFFALSGARTKIRL